MSQVPSEKKDDLGILFDTTLKETNSEVVTNGAPIKTYAPVTSVTTSHLSGQGGAFDVGKAFTGDHAETGTIVSDKRYTRPSVGESLKEAWSEWWNKVSVRVKKVVESTPHPTNKAPAMVAHPETRKDIITKAAHHSTIAPKDDHKIVVEKLRTMGSDAKRITGSPIIITPPIPNSSRGTWSHHVEEPKELPHEKKPLPLPDLRHITIAPEIAKKNVWPAREVFGKTQEEKLEAPTSTPLQKIVVPFRAQKKDGSLLKNVVHIAPRVQRDTDTTYSTPIPQTSKGVSVPLMKRETTHTVPEAPRTHTHDVSETTSREVTASRVIPPSSSQAPQPDIPTDSRVNERPVFHGSHTDWSVKELSPTHVHRETPVVPQGARTQGASRYTPFTWMILGGIVLLGSTLAIIANLYINVFRTEKPTNTLVEEVPDAQPPVDEVSVETITITEDPRASLTSLNDAVLRVKPARTEIRLVVTQGGVRRVATTEELLLAIHAHLNPSALRALDDSFAVGSVTTVETVPYFVFRTAYFDTLFAGLLAWEEFIYTDFSPLFGEHALTHSIFKDVIVKGRPARILMNDAGLDTLAYGFLNQNTIIITKNREALEKLFLEL